MVKIGIVGGTGYTGVELLRILCAHPHAQLCAITSRTEAGRPVADLYPNLRGHTDLCFVEPSEAALAGCDLVFFATPHGVAMAQAPALLARGIKVVDLSADFRLRDLDVFAQWYGMTHSAPDWAAKAVYGLPELNRADIQSADLVAAPGCYPTAVQLALAPLLAAGLVDPSDLIADCKSGVSGAGRGANVGALFAEVNDSFKAYGVSGHRHLPEISQQLSIAAGTPVGLVFTPHLTPMTRGIHATCYARLTADADLQALFESTYADEPMVDVMPAGSHPETRSVRGSNQCRLAVHRAPGSDRVVVLAVEDNLVKGASGQAVQCMNLMLGLDESAGLGGIGLLP
ncbi:N-acetyl-gamma-glutamyl-phosphate reductase [Litorivicinus lipolyticus]|uniref:N-acetyl-gamma-glutamyl-phosphate reductase n=1 Tax=Litorivicinus lipolyticus TaxID=418701 RepID=A0A5Q2QD71_9GAMM|nr:N-acetyl-gamma-glutamyl-phosphate reductase [Litorivicinus lipolyticus]QGG81084.1 N-acetyl-gamma-glutamyl-phosphate reductase [Litorivicinus lipolyticus]